MKISIVLKEHIDGVWDSIRDMVVKTCAYSNGRYTADDVLKLLLNDKLMLWIAFDDDMTIHGFSVTCITHYPSKRALTVAFLGGVNAKIWLGVMDDVLIKWARDNGCDCLEGTGRSGWMRVKPSLNLRKMKTQFEKDI